MSIADEQDLRQQLGGVLDAIMPPEAPVSAAVRKGKLIQAGRSLGIVAGLAVVTGLGVGTPSLLNQPGGDAVSHAKPTVMVQQICPTTQHGAQGAAGRAALAAKPYVRPSSSASPAGELPYVRPSLSASPAGELPSAALVAGGCAWVEP